MTEISSLFENVVPVPFTRGTTSLELQVNVDAVTPEFWREKQAQFQKRFQAMRVELKETIRHEAVDKARETKRLTNAQQTAQAERRLLEFCKTQLDSFEARAKQMEIERETNIEFLLPHVLKGWNATENGQPVPLTKEVLMPLPPALIQDLFDTCFKAARRTNEETQQRAGGKVLNFDVKAEKENVN